MRGINFFLDFYTNKYPVVDSVCDVRVDDVSLQWRHSVCHGVSNNQTHDCLLIRLFKAQIKKNIKAPRHWPLWEEFTGDRWISRTKGQLREKCSHLMTSSCRIELTTVLPGKLIHWAARYYNNLSGDIAWLKCHIPVVFHQRLDSSAA